MNTVGHFREWNFVNGILKLMETLISRLIPLSSWQMILHLTLGTLGLAFISDRLSMYRISEGSPCVFRRQFSSIITSCYVVMVRIDDFFVIFEEEIFHRLLSGILQRCILPYNVVLSPRSVNSTAVPLNRLQLNIGDYSYSIASFHQNIYFTCFFISTQHNTIMFTYQQIIIIYKRYCSHCLLINGKIYKKC